MLLGFVPPELIKNRTNFKKHNPVANEIFAFFNAKSFFISEKYTKSEKKQYASEVQITIRKCIKACTALLSYYDINPSLSFEERIIEATDSWAPLDIFMKTLPNSENDLRYDIVTNPIRLELESNLFKLKLQLNNTKDFTSKNHFELLLDAGLIDPSQSESTFTSSNLEKLLGQSAFTIESIHKWYFYETGYALQDGILNWLTSSLFYSNQYCSSYLVVDYDLFKLYRKDFHGNLVIDTDNANYVTNKKIAHELTTSFIEDMKQLLREIDSELSSLEMPNAETKSMYQETGKKMFEASKKGVKLNPVITNKQINMNKCYELYDKLLVSKKFYSEADIKRTIADELHKSEKTIDRYLKQRTK